MLLPSLFCACARDCRSRVTLTSTDDGAIDLVVDTLHPIRLTRANLETLREMIGRALTQPPRLEGGAQ